MGGILSTWRDNFPPASRFDIERDVPDLTGKVFLVTGGNTGVGKVTVEGLLRHNATVYLAARDETKGRAAIEDLKEKTGHEARFLQLDLADLASVRRAANEFIEKEKTLDVLINNAGVLMPPIEQLTKDGYDLSFGTNVLGPFYFTKLLLPVLRRTSAAHPAAPARIITVGSTAGFMVPTIDFNTLRDAPARLRMPRTTAYMQSKLGNFVCAAEMARREDARKKEGEGEGGEVVSVAINPGALDSDLGRHVDSWAMKVVLRIINYPIEMGALTSVYAATHPDAAVNGKYFVPWAREGEMKDVALDPALGKELWTWLEEQVDAFEARMAANESSA
ncbi:NAD-P-binding protein [Dentipellis sp. KUC8613]|nr:NAD-P-binding protein [Dentipellis sp. KUC8613]